MSERAFPQYSKTLTKSQNFSIIEVGVEGLPLAYKLIENKCSMLHLVVKVDSELAQELT